MTRFEDQSCPICGGVSVAIAVGEYFCLDGNYIWIRIESTMPEPTCQGMDPGSIEVCGRWPECGCEGDCDRWTGFWLRPSDD